MNNERMLMVLQSPRISEKSTNLADKYKQYTFNVLKNATKPEIKAAVEKMFNVKVQAVTVVNIKGKTKRFKQIPGKRADIKKAYVTLLDGHDIDFNISD